jgi:tripartite-type tricarboxylate transporter receptor subunit TctC
MKIRDLTRLLLSIPLAALVIAAAYVQGASAQEDAAKNFPNKPIRLIVGFAAGGGNDILARLIGQKMAEGLGQSVIIENKPGAGAIIATEYVAKTSPDGYTLLVGASGAMAINPAVYTNLRYATLRDFVPVSMLASFPLILVVNPALPIRSVQDLVAYAKANPAKANYGGSSTAFQLATELFKIKTGAPLEHIAYKSSNESVSAVISGEVLMTIADTPPVSGQLKGGQVRGLAVTSAKRMSEFPDLPTMAEAGVPDVEIGLWSGIFVPAGTPTAIVRKLQDEIVRSLGLPDIRQRMQALGVDPVGNTSAEFARIIAADIDRWTAVAKAGNVKIE